MDKTIIVYPIIDWSFRFQRPQHLAKNLSESYKVFYLTTTFGQHTQPGYDLVSEGKITVIQLYTNRQINMYATVLEEVEIRFICESILKLMNDFEVSTLTHLIQYPFWQQICSRLRGNIVYDCMDHHAGFETGSDGIHSIENKLFNSADLVVCSSDNLKKTILQKARRKVHVVRNGCEYQKFDQIRSLPKTKEKTIVGYIGAISSWFDSELICKAAKQYPQYEFWLIGSTHGVNHEKSLKKQPNIKLFGEIDYEKLADYLKEFDVAVIPFEINDLIKHTDPVKVYEYLAAGKQVVSTALPEIKYLDSYIFLSQTHDEFINNIQAALDHPKASHNESDENIIIESDWKNRTHLFASKVEELMPKVSIIILTYNNLDLTKKCLESIEKNTTYTNYEIIIVDNNSTDGTPEYLPGIDNPRMQCFFNKQNEGFAAGNNIGIKKASGDIVILLNNDTEVTQGWIEGLIRPLLQQKSVGIVGPVTNNIGNEAKIADSYINSDHNLTADHYRLENQIDYFNLRSLAFFCVAIRKDTFMQIGYLDERFSYGSFEDDDFCRRLIEAGYSCVLAENVYIYHHLSATIDLVNKQRKTSIFEENKVVFEEKWGAWEKHKYRTQKL